MTELKVLTPDDWAAWRELRLVALAEAPYAFGATLADWQGQGDREERWRARLGIPGSINLLAMAGGRAVGMVSGVPGPSDGMAELISMWVGPAARGQGVGDLLVRAVGEWAERSGARVLRLAVSVVNTRAIELYRRNGFEDIGEFTDVPAREDGRREGIMAKALGHLTPGRAPA